MRRPIVFVVLAGLAAMLASVVVYSALKRRDAEVQQALAKNVEIVVAAYDLPLGTKIEASELKLAKWSSDAMPVGAYTDPRQAIGSYVKSGFVSNEPIVANKLFIGEKTAGIMPLLIPFGMRAVSVPVDEVSDIAGFVLPHTRVDVLVALSGSDANNKALAKIVLQNVEVLAVAQEIEMKKDTPEVVKVVTLLVSPQEAERLALASREGSLRLAMRNYNDNKIVLTRGSDVAQMLRAYSLEPELPVMTPQAGTRRVSAPAPRSQPFQVEIYRNGKSSESMSFINEAAAGAPSHKHPKTASNAGDRSSAPDKTAMEAPADHEGAIGAAEQKVSDTDSSTAKSAGVSAAPAPAPRAAAVTSTNASLTGAMPSDGPSPKTIEIP
ncbi:MAG TPA: Flp pilus assembly protein CpaB [Candidatus Binataceae bacterium]|nr:Flp pilus assembly protein CpaB [Candidatus Binataceae bacterium]